MTVKKTERLIVKFITNQANLEEIDTLTQWLEASADNQKVFKDFVKINYAVDYAVNSFDADAAKQHLMKRIKQDRNVFLKRNIQSYLKYAAVLVCGLIAFNFFQENKMLIQKEKIITPVEEFITLQSDSGEVQVINPSSSINITDKSGKIIGRQDKSKIRYSDDDSAEILAYNIIKVPNGKRFELALSDGTIVHLNSGSSLRYPVRFIKGENRHVFLNGEAYFDVTKDAKHPFIVDSNDMIIKVLGTKFNVTSYKEDAKTYTVLVEGSVAAHNTILENEEVLLKPGNRAYFENQHLKTESVNITKYIAWVAGELMFIDDSFGVIANKLGRKYNVKIVNNYHELNNIMITATFKGEDIEQVLKTFQTYKAFNYTIKNRVITITKP